MRAIQLAITASAMLLASMAGALAHAFLDHAAPAVGSTVRGSPSEVKIWFSEELQPAFSTIQVVDQSGARVDKDDKQVDPKDQTELKISLKPLTPGSYQVIWRVLSVDSHVTDGKFKFQVAK